MHLDCLGWEGASVVYYPTNKHSFSLGLYAKMQILQRDTKDKDYHLFVLLL